MNGSLSFLAAVLLTVAAPAAESAKEASRAVKHYGEVKQLLATYAADDTGEKGGVSALGKIKALGNEAVPAAQAIFVENKSDDVRSAIVTVLVDGKSDKAKGVDFLLSRLTGEAKQWEGEGWIATAVEKIAAADAEKGRDLALRALSSPSGLIKYEAVTALGQVGVAADVKTLNALMIQAGKENPIQVDDYLVSLASQAIEKITERHDTIR